MAISISELGSFGMYIVPRKGREKGLPVDFRFKKNAWQERLMDLLDSNLEQEVLRPEGAPL